MTNVQLVHGDCLEALAALPRHNIDLVFADLPYGMHKQTWDSVIPLPELWQQLHGACTSTAGYLMTATHPFARVLLSSNLENFRYDLIWDKGVSGAFAVAKHRPLPLHEMIYVFGKGFPYNPQMVPRSRPVRVTEGSAQSSVVLTGMSRAANLGKVYKDRFPTSVLRYSPRADRERGLHPTQKPVELLKYLIRTYSNPGDTVLDPCMGSGSSGVAAVQCGRNFVGIERDDHYFAVAKERIGRAQSVVP